MRKPDFFIAGAPRCGTTSMYAYLRQHPQIHASVHKEPHFFGSDLTPLPGAIRDEELYLALFAGAGDRPRAGESSVHYLSSRRAPFEIRDYAPEARIIILLREPVAMAHSLYSLYTRTGNEDLDTFEEALDAEAERREGRRIPAGAYFPEGLQYTEEAHHAGKVERWLEVFGSEQVLCILFDDFVRDTAAVYRRTLEFLGVDPDFAAELDPQKAADLARIQAIRQLRHTPPEVRRRMQFDQMKVHQGPPRPAPGAALTARLRERFAPDVERLGRLLGRDLSAWTRGEALSQTPPPVSQTSAASKPAPSSVPAASGKLSEVLVCVKILRQIPAELRARQDRVETLERKFARWQRLRLPELPLEQRAYDPAWAAWFAAEEERIAAALAPRAARIEHFGSTAVPGLGSKNIIDIALGVDLADGGDAEAVDAALAAIGYASFGNSPIDPVTRWLWRVEDDRAFVIHLCDRGRQWLDEQADLRDYLRACPDERERYATLKRQLAAENGSSFLSYSVGKMALSLELVARAMEWRAVREESSSGRRS